MKKLLALSIFSLLLWSCDQSSLNEEKPEPQDPDAISIEGAKEYNLSEKSASVTLNVVCSTDWTCNLGGVEWISEAGRGKSFLKLQIAANDGTAERSADVVFKSASGKEASVKLIQAGKPVPATLELDRRGPFNILAEGIKGLAIAVTASLGEWEYEVAGSPGWVKVEKTASGISVDVEANPLEEARSTSISFYSPSKKDSRATVTVYLNQAGAIVVEENLSLDGTANSYLIVQPGHYYFDATVRGNGRTVEGLDAPSALSVSGARLVWQTKAGMIKSVSYAAGKISINVGEVNGNALVAALDGSGNIIWSWHIWFPKVLPKGLQSSTGDVVMEYNLGALSSNNKSVESYGLLYQWGRKDPFPGSPVMNGGNLTMTNVPVYDIDGKEVKITHEDALGTMIPGNHLEYSISHPTVCIGNRLQYAEGCRDWLPATESNAALWGNPAGSERNEAQYPNAGSKSYFDPCPVGWRVPPISTFQPFTKTGGIAWASGNTDNFIWGDLGGATTTAVVDLNGDGKYSLDDDWTDGWHIYLDQEKGIYSYFPATTRYDGQYAMFMGSMVGIWGNYWTNSTDGKDNGLSEALSFGIKDYGSTSYTITISPLSSGSRADAYAVRCIKE